MKALSFICLALTACAPLAKELPADPALSDVSAGESCYERQEHIGDRRLYHDGKSEPIVIRAQWPNTFASVDVVNNLSSPLLVWPGSDKKDAKFIAAHSSAWWSIAPARSVHLQQTFVQPAPGFVRIRLTSCRFPASSAQ